MKALKKQFQKPDGCSGWKFEGFGYPPASPPAHARAPRHNQKFVKNLPDKWKLNETVGKNNVNQII